MAEKIPERWRDSEALNDRSAENHRDKSSPYRRAGKLIWDSSKKGAYVRAIHGPIGSDKERGKA